MDHKKQIRRALAKKHQTSSPATPDEINGLVHAMDLKLQQLRHRLAEIELELQEIRVLQEAEENDNPSSQIV